MRVDDQKRLIALNVGLVANELRLSDKFSTAMSVLMDVPEQLPPEAGISAPQTGGLLDPAKNTANQVMQHVLATAFADPAWAFEVYFTVLTPESAEALKKKQLGTVRGTLDVFVMVDERSVATPDPGLFLHPVLTAIAPRLIALRKQRAAAAK
ncbi:MAG: hypothetical protein IPJ65_09000 [Archangiaceae bacterium]|nr:hypothetical protein [Archangiaceae bacterium]